MRERLCQNQLIALEGGRQQHNFLLALVVQHKGNISISQCSLSHNVELIWCSCNEGASLKVLPYSETVCPDKMATT